jgi:sugar lactone lactonase YvrE
MAFGLGGLPESYGEPKGRLWRYDPDGSLHEMASGFVCGNGVDWSPDNKTCKLYVSNVGIVLMDEVYLNDSVGQKSFAFDFDLDTGNISNRRLLVDMRGTGGEPDGLVVEYEIPVDAFKIYTDKSKYRWQYLDGRIRIQPS